MIEKHTSENWGNGNWMVNPTFGGMSEFDFQALVAADFYLRTTNPKETT